MRQLSGLDAQFLALETDTVVGHVGGLAVFDPSTAPGGRLGVEEVRAVVTARLHLLPPLRWKLVTVPLGLDRPYWAADPDFDVARHVHEVVLDEPGDERQLADVVARLAAERLDRRKPLWEIHVIRGLVGGRIAVLTRMHHAVIDGVSGAEVMGVLWDLSPEGRDVPPPPPEEDDPSLSPPAGTLEMLGRGLTSLPRQPLRALRAAPSMLAHADVAPSVLGLPGAEPISRGLSRVRQLVGGAVGPEVDHVIERPSVHAPRGVPFSGRISARRTFAFGSLSLPHVKAVKNRFGVTVNDVVVALAAGAVREWLLHHEALPEEPLVAQIPVSVRTEEQIGTYGNRVSVMIVPIPTHLPEAADRLDHTHATLRAAKERHRALPATTLQDATAFIPPAINARAASVALQLASSAVLRPLFNLIVSNVPGPPVPLYLAGATLEAHYPVSVVADGSGLNITVMSYLDRMDVGIVADPEQIPDADRLVDVMGDELEALCAAAGVEDDVG